jgi:hypothetical protein
MNALKHIRICFLVCSLVLTLLLHPRTSGFDQVCNSETIHTGIRGSPLSTIRTHSTVARRLTPDRRANRK